MSQEIIYTSAPKGLKPGSSGFCTVVSTAGMAINLAERLESLSGYRHLYGPHEGGVNPVNFSHLTLIVGGQKFHVLSRIADAGLDYTKRTNKIAHHIAMTTSEIASNQSGPAHRMRENGFFVMDWDGKVETIAETRRVSDDEIQTRKCNAWQSVTGDGGWAGELARVAVEGKRPLSIIYAEQTDALQLVDEALALLPPSKRWDVTFNTYFTKLPAGVDCLWRFVPDKTSEATSLRRDPHSRAIDLCSQLTAAPDSEWAVAARTGNPCYSAEEKSVAILRRKTSFQKFESDPRIDLVEPEKIYKLEETQPRRHRRGIRTPAIRKSHGFPVGTVVAIAILLIFGLGGLLAIRVAMTGRFDPDQLASSEPSFESNQNSERETNQAPSPPPQERDASRDEIPFADSEATELARSEEIRQRLDQASAEAEMSKKPVLTPYLPKENSGNPGNSDKERPLKRESPFEDITLSGNRLFLPASAEESSFQTIARVYAADARSFALTLSQGKQQNEQELKVDPEFSIDGTLYVLKRRGAGLWDTIGTFRLEGEELQFEWESWSTSIAKTRLLLSVDGLSQDIQLILAAESVEPLQMRFDKPRFIHQLPISTSAFAYYEVRLLCDSLLGMSYEPSGEVPKHESVHIICPIDVPGPAEAFWIEVKVVHDDQTPDQAALEFTAKADLQMLDSDLLDSYQEIDDVVAKKLNDLPAINFPKVKSFVNDLKLNSLRSVCQQKIKFFEAYADAWKRESEQEEIRLKKNVKLANAKESEAEVKLKNAQRMRESLPPEQKTEMDEEVKRAQENLKKAKKQQEQEINNLKTPVIREKVVQELTQIASETIVWCDHLDEIFAKIHDEGRLHLRLQSDDQVLLTTVGWESVSSTSPGPSALERVGRGAESVVEKQNPTELKSVHTETNGDN